jgi:hypothetical protein
MSQFLERASALFRPEAEDGGYHGARARQERDMALHARTQAAARAHEEMAAYHEALIPLNDNQSWRRSETAPWPMTEEAAIR